MSLGHEEPQIISREFNEDMTELRIKYRKRSIETLLAVLSTPPRFPLDIIWMEIYRIKDGKFYMYKTIKGKHTPGSINPEKLEFSYEEEK